MAITRSNVVTILTFTLLVFLYIPANLYANQGNVVLWNKLGSEEEILTSEIGSDGDISPAIGFTPIEHGDGVALKSGVPQVKFDRPFGTSFPDAGTIEFWWVPGRDENSSTGSHFDEREAVVITSDAKRSNNFPEMGIYLMSHSGNYGDRTRVAMVLGDQDRIIIEYDFDFLAGDKIHVAVTWDKTLGASPLKTYFNGVEGTVIADLSTNPELVIGAIQTEIQDSNYSYDLELFKRSKRPDGAHNEFDTEAYVDNLVVWNYAKTDFSDRFEESPLPCTLNVDLSHTDNTLDMKFELGAKTNSKWSVFLVRRGIKKVFSSRMAIDPPVILTISIPEFENQGTVGVLTTLVKGEDVIICSDFETINTGQPEGESALGDSTLQIEEIRRLFEEKLNEIN